MKDRLPLPARLWQGFTIQLFLFAFLPLTVLLLVVTFGSLSLHHEAMRSLVADRNLRAVQAAAAGLNKEILHQGEMTTLAAESLQQEAVTRSDLNLLAQEMPSFSGNVALFSSQGELLAASDQAAGWPDALQRTFNYVLQDLLEKSAGAYAISPATQLESGTLLVFTGARTAHNDLLVGAFSPQDLIQHSLSWFTGQVSVTVVDRQGEVLYQNQSAMPADLAQSGDLVAQALQGTSGIDFTPGHGDEHVVAYSPVAPMGWVLLLEEPWETITSPLLRITQYSPLILLPVLVLAVVALWFGLRQIIQPLQTLETRAADLAEGDFDSIREPAGGIPEIRHLQSALVETAGQLQIAQENLHGYIGALTEGVEQERRSLARELHDDTLQALIALNQRLQLSMMQVTTPEERSAIQEVQQLVQQTMVNLRRLVRGLRPIYLEDLGLSAALGMLAREASRPDGPVIQFELQGDEQRLPPEAEMALYRMAQEAVSNAVRHSQAANTWIRLNYSEDEAVLTVEDDGCGFDVPMVGADFAKKGHYGLLGLRERAELTGARLEIRSAPGRGTKVLVRLPLPPWEADTTTGTAQPLPRL